jgi:SgrR family transcriptional regulator
MNHPLTVDRYARGFFVMQRTRIRCPGDPRSNAAGHDARQRGKLKWIKFRNVISSFMRLLDRFHRLHAIVVLQSTQPGLPALATALNCSERNVRILLRKMEQQGWLRWEAARGRGHFSRLTMLVSPQHAALDHVSDLLEEGELEQAFASLNNEQRKQLATRLPDFLRIKSAGEAYNRLRIPLYRALEGLDPYAVTSRLESHLVRQIFSTLTEFDKNTQQLTPALAHHWESEDDAKVWHFWLRPGVRFHDGAELETADVRHTLLRMRDEPSYFKRLYSHLKAVETGAARKVTCQLKTTDHLWPQRLASANASIVPRHRSHDFLHMPIGTGPFKLTRHSEYRVTLSAFKDYYRERALLDEIDLWMLTACDRPAEFDLQFGYSAPGPKAQNSIVRVQAGCTYVICNARRDLFASTAQRLALADWLAPTALIAKEKTARRPASGLLPIWQHRVAVPGRRPQIPKRTKLTMVTGQTDGELALARLIKNRLQEAEIELHLMALPYVDLIRRDWLNAADLFLGSEILHDDEDFGCYEWFAADSEFRRWMPAQRRLILDHQLKAVQGRNDAKARMHDYADIGRQLVEEGWLIPISHEHQHVDVEPHVAGVKTMPLGFVSFADLWVR